MDKGEGESKYGEYIGKSKHSSLTEIKDTLKSIVGNNI
jgi:hypothetical protein